MKILIFSQILSGHNLEYLNHYNKLAILHPQDIFFFVVPEFFKKCSTDLMWEPADNIHYIYYSDEEAFKYLNSGSLFKTSWIQCCLLRRYYKKIKPDKILLTVFMSFLPFLPFFIWKKKAVSGIIYRIYLYELEDMNRAQRIVEKIKYFLLSLMPCFDNIFILNDAVSAARLRQLYCSKRFISLPDPYIPLSTNNNPMSPHELGLGNFKYLFINVGDLTKRKGTIEILKSLYLLSEIEKQELAFAFAGRVNSDIRNEFYMLLEDLKEKGFKISVKDEFCSYNYIAKLCSICTAILIPYHNTSQSSGLLGYSSQFQKPVIATNSGMIGELVRKYNLGFLINDIIPSALCNAYREAINGQYYVSADYCKHNTVDNFIDVLSKTILKCE